MINYDGTQRKVHDISGFLNVCDERLDKFVFACTDPESFVRGGPTLTTLFFILMKGGRIQIPLLAGYQRRHLNGVSLAGR